MVEAAAGPDAACAAPFVYSDRTEANRSRRADGGLQRRPHRSLAFHRHFWLRAPGICSSQIPFEYNANCSKQVFRHRSLLWNAPIVTVLKSSRTPKSDEDVLRHRIGPTIMSANVDTATDVVERCVSCDTPLTGPYCSRCGERTLEPEALTLRHFVVHTVAHELLHVDGALWRTLRLLFVRPGRLSLEYAAGRRRPYVNPFRLLLIAIVAYVPMSSGFVVTWNFGPVIMSIAPPVVRRSLSVEDTIEQVDRYGLLRQQVAAKREQLAGEAARERFHERLAAFAEPVSFTNVVLLAATLHLVFRRKRRRFLEHAAFSMHGVSFVLLSSLTLFVAIRLRSWLGPYLLLTFGCCSCGSSRI